MSKRKNREAGSQVSITETKSCLFWENAKIMRQAGADIFVAGTSSIFKPGADLLGLTRAFREAIA
ncbi:hypothetical protein ACFSR7_27805 [Cohnella sp. GCM10020058]|uniref:hypothetical protein n=1 Tax=Cohnella sp. GCM10020058 TaxID=3317330 RepID=UPI003624BE10